MIVFTKHVLQGPACGQGPMSPVDRLDTLQKATDARALCSSHASLLPVLSLWSLIPRSLCPQQLSLARGGPPLQSTAMDSPMALGEPMDFVLQHEISISAGTVPKASASQARRAANGEGLLQPGECSGLMFASDPPTRKCPGTNTPPSGPPLFIPVSQRKESSS